MTDEQYQQPPSSNRAAGRHISLDWWAVLTALVLVLLILAGIIPDVPW